MTINRRSIIRLLRAGVCSMVISGCGGGSTITHSYVDPVLRKLDLEGVMVVAVAQQYSSRVEFEDAFTKALGRNGVRAVASYTLLPKQDASAEEVLNVAQRADLDTILITRYMGKTSEDVYHPGTIYYGVTPAYGAPYYRGFGGYYGHAYEVAYQQPVWTSNVTHTLISDLYVTSSKEHMWQAVSDTIQAGSTTKLRNDAIQGLVRNLKDQDLLD